MSLKRTAILMSLLAGLATLTACGGVPTFPEYRPEAFPPVRTTLAQEAFQLEPGEAFFVDVPARQLDVVYATIDWTHAENNVVAALAATTCSGVNLALAGNCRQGLGFTEPSTCAAKPRVVTATVQSTDRIRLYVANSGRTAELGRIQITTCADSPNCGAGAACGQCSLEAHDLNSCP